MPNDLIVLGFLVVVIIGVALIFKGFDDRHHKNSKKSKKK
jgi:putative Mn2+ efflux pump MntP